MATSSVRLAVACACALLTACGGGGGGGAPPPPPPPPTYTVSATVTGLDADGLVLQNNGGNDLAVASDGTVTFPGQG